MSRVDNPGEYDVPFVADSSHGHIVELLVEHVDRRGVVVDLGCGYAPHADPLVEAGFGFVGFDVDPDAVGALGRRGHEAAVLDLGASDVATELDALLADRDVVAVLVLDVLEHLVSPHRTLGEIVSWMRRHSIDHIGVSLPNVSHQDVANKLLAGRWQLTPSGLLDHTHLRFFTERGVDVLVRSAGLVEVGRHDVTSPTSEQHWPADHPMIGDAAQLAHFLRSVRRLTDEHGATFQFVRLFAASPAPPVGGSGLLDGPDSAEPVGLSVLIAPSDERDDVRDIVESALASQTSDDVELIADGDAVDDMLARSRGRYVVVLDAADVGEHLATDEWAAQFLAAADLAPGAILRCGPSDPDAPWAWDPGFDVIASLAGGDTPSTAVAYPRPLLTDLDLGAVNGRSRLMIGAPIAGVVDTRAAAAAARVDWRERRPDIDDAIDRLDREPLLLPVGAARHLIERAEHADRRSTAAAAEIAGLRDHAKALETDNRWLNEQLAWWPLRVMRRAFRRSAPASR